MKKVLLTAAALFAFGFANAQDTKFGAKAGLDIVSFSGNGSSTSLTGFFVGGFAEFGIADKMMLQPGLNYHSASKTETINLGPFGSSEIKVEANFISVPVMLKYEVAESFNLMGGPALYYNVTSGVTTDKTRFNLELGASYDFTDNLFVEPRYSIGLNGEAKASHLLIGVGYKF